MLYKVKKIEIWDKYVEADSEEEAIKKETYFQEMTAYCEFEKVLIVEEVC